MGNEINLSKSHSNKSYSSLDSPVSSPHSNTHKSFGLHGKSIKLIGKNDSTMIVRKSSSTLKNGSKNNCVYAHDWIHSNTNNIHKYLIEIKKMTGNIKIGFTSDDYHIDECFENGTNNHYYSFWPNGTFIINNPDDTQRQIVKKQHFDHFEEGDLIQITMDLSNDRIYFGKSVVIPIIKSDDIRYKLVISASKKGDSVSIKDYNIEYGEEDLSISEINTDESISENRD